MHLPTQHGICDSIPEGSADLDFVFLEPGPWGRFKGLSVLKSGADLLLDMGITAVRVRRGEGSVGET